MTIQRMENVGIVVDDLAAATAFFVELGLTVLAEGPVDGDWVDRVVGLEGVRMDVARLETLDGHGRLELMTFHAPTARGGDRHALANTLGIGVSHLQSMTSTPPSPGCKPGARSSLVGWNATKTVTGSATSAVRRGASSCLRSRSAEGSGRPLTGLASVSGLGEKDPSSGQRFRATRIASRLSMATISALQVRHPHVERAVITPRASYASKVTAGTKCAAGS